MDTKSYRQALLPMPELMMTLQEQLALPPHLAAEPIDALELTTRTANVLRRAGIMTIGQVGALNESDLLAIRSMQGQALHEIRQALAAVRDRPEPQRTAEEQTSASRTELTFGDQYEILSEIGALPLSVLKLQQRTYNALSRGGIHRLRELAAHSRTSLGALNNVGEKALDEVADHLASLDVAALRAIAADLPRIECLSLSNVRGHLGLDGRVAAGLVEAGISTLGELLGAREAGRLASLDQRYRTEANQAISQLDLAALATRVDSLEPTNAQHAEDSAAAGGANIAVREQIGRLLQVLDERDRQIIMLRFGLEDGASYTLDQVGERLGVTRERIRQRESKALARLQAHRALVQPLVARLEQALKQRFGVLSLEASLAAVCETADCAGVSPEMLVRFLLELSSTVELVREWPILVLTSDADAVLSRQVPVICQALKQVLVAAQGPLHRDEVVAQVKLTDGWRRLPAPTTDAVLQVCIDAHPEIIVEPDGTCELKRRRVSRPDTILQVLRDQGTPLHFTMIAELVNQRLPEDQRTTQQTIYNYLLAQSPSVFVRVGRGTFGLAEWGLEPRESSAEIAYRLLQEAGTPLDLKTLVDRVLEVWQGQPSSVRAAIELDARFLRLRPDVYGLVDRDTPDSTGAETDPPRPVQPRTPLPAIPTETLRNHLRDLLADGQPRTVADIAQHLEAAGVGSVPQPLISRILLQQGCSTFTFDRETGTFSLGTASPPPGPPTYDRYDEWTQALISFFVESSPRGMLIFLSIDEETLPEVARLLPTPSETPVDDFLMAVRARVVAGNRVDLASLQGRYPGGKPHCVAFLAATVLAAAHMAEGEEEGQEVGAHNYFRRLRDVLGLPLEPGRPAGMESGAEAEEPLWTTWNQWLQEQGFLPSARRAEAAGKFIRYPISQALLRKSDKDRLARMFEVRKWTEPMETETLITQLRREQASLSQHLRELLAAEGQRLQAVGEVIAEYHDIWREGGTVKPLSTFPPAGLYRTEDIITGAIRYFLYPRQPRRRRPEQVRIRVGDVSYGLVDERPGWYAPVAEIPLSDLDQGGVYPIEEPPHLGHLELPRRSFWMLVPDRDNPNSGVYALWGRASLGTPFVLLCRRDELPRLEQLRAERLIQWAGEPQELAGSEHWIEIQHCMVLSQARGTDTPANQALYDALRPRETLSISFSGGLRAPIAGAWIEGFGPDVTAYAFQPISYVTIVPVADETQGFDVEVEAGRPCQVPWRGPGDYRIEACVGGQPTERLVKIVPWEHVRRVPVTKPETIRMGQWQIAGATIEMAP